jgi:hypothetical protein
MVMSVNEKMSALANEIRELSGATELLGIDKMTTNVSDANDEVSVQTSLITQLVDTLQGKVAGSNEDVTVETDTYTAKITSLETAVTALENELAGKTSSGNVETCTLEFTNINFTTLHSGQASYLTFENGIITPHMINHLKDLPTTISNCITGSMFIVYKSNINYTFIPETECEEIGDEFDRPMYYFKITATNGQIARIKVEYNDF